jgi:undecaprenyl diphosphate synthase
VAIIPDGSGRWAAARGLPRAAGHRAGVDAVRETVEAAARLAIGTLTLFAFSSDNWRRPLRETAHVLRCVRGFLVEAAQGYPERGIRVTVVGRRDRLPAGLLAAIGLAERATARASRMHLRIALDYSARRAILHTVRRLAGARRASAAGFARLLAAGGRGRAGDGDVDLLVRTGGEQRLSDFMLWECAYAELLFTSTLWPDFTARDLEEAVREYQARERRYGGLPQSAWRGGAGT